LRRQGAAVRVLWNSHRDFKCPTAGGAERTIHEIGKRLTSRGHSVTLIAAAWAGAARREVSDGIVIRRFPGNAILHGVVPVVAAEHPRPDVIVDDLAHALPWFSPWISRLPGTAFFHHLHARTLPGQVRSSSVAAALSRLERAYPLVYRDWSFVTESEGSLRDLVELGVEAERCLRIPPGVDSGLFAPAPKSAEPTLLYAAGFREYKRPDHAILIHERLLEQGLRNRLRLVGVGPSLPRLRKMVYDRELTSSVDILGRVSDAELARIAAESWVNIHCSVAEGWGFSILESAAAGTPTVAYRVPGVSEAILDGVSGLLCPDGDVPSMASAVTRVMAETDRWGRQAREWASNFSWDRAANLWEHHLLALCHGV
jgi:glycosyltransferase involved in cell wall biosynthesis